MSDIAFSIQLQFQTSSHILETLSEYVLEPSLILFKSTFWIFSAKLQVHEEDFFAVDKNELGVL